MTFEFEFASNSTHDSNQVIMAPFNQHSFNTLQVKSITFETISISNIVLLKRMISDVKMEVASMDEMDNQDSIINVLSNQEDLIKGFYEGGFKTWECSLDLVQFLSTCPPEFFNQKRMLEVGCGSALPGIYALQRGASVDFSDYNEQVLEMITAPNVLLNLLQSDIIQNAKQVDDYEVDLDYTKLQEIPSRFFSGDWKYVCEALDPQSYDVILTSETIYDTGSFEKLYNLFKKLIKPEGCIYVAAKSCYFGCSGSLISFIDYIKMKGTCQITSIYSNTCAVRREIVCIQF